MELTDKIENVKSGRSSSEIFDKRRPPEEFGEAVELFYDRDAHTFKAVVFDPQMKTVFEEKPFTNEQELRAFINRTVY